MTGRRLAVAGLGLTAALVVLVPLWRSASPGAQGPAAAAIAAVEAVPARAPVAGGATEGALRTAEVASPPLPPLDALLRLVVDELVRRANAGWAWTWTPLPQGRMLVLTGNVHAMLKPPSMIDDGYYRTATQLLADLKPFAVRLTASSGEFWACMAGTCGPRRMYGPEQTGVFGDQFHFQYALPAFSVARLIGDDGQ